jgi:hypothetical protein
VEKVKIDYDNKTAHVTMKLGSVLNKDIVAKAFKETNRYGMTGFAENKPAIKKPICNMVTLGVSGMT